MIGSMNNEKNNFEQIKGILKDLQVYYPIPDMVTDISLEIEDREYFRECVLKYKIHIVEVEAKFKIYK